MAPWPVSISGTSTTYFTIFHIIELGHSLLFPLFLISYTQNIYIFNVSLRVFSCFPLLIVFTPDHVCFISVTDNHHNLLVGLALNTFYPVISSHPIISSLIYHSLLKSLKQLLIVPVTGTRSFPSFQTNFPPFSTCWSSIHVTPPTAPEDNLLISTFCSRVFLNASSSELE